PWMIKLAAICGVGVLRLWMKTIRRLADPQGQLIEPWDPRLREYMIYTLWHDSLLCVPRLSTCLPATALIIQSRDGELLATIAKHYGIDPVRGSSSRGGIDAITDAVDAGKRSHLVVAPDGPRGPRRQVKRGLVYLASWTGMKIVPLGVGFDRAWHARSWD